MVSLLFLIRLFIYLNLLLLDYHFQTMYRNLVSATTPIESGLHKQLAAHLNSEIVLHTINDFADAMKWMRSTFLYVRAVANPTYYGIQSKCAIAIENELKGKTQLCRCCDER